MAGVAGAGELLISEQVATAVELDTDDLEHREVALKGKAAPLLVWVETPTPVPA
jgi:class 3 adenylate cyclase